MEYKQYLRFFRVYVTWLQNKIYILLKSVQFILRESVSHKHIYCIIHILYNWSRNFNIHNHIQSQYGHTIRQEDV